MSLPVEHVFQVRNNKGLFRVSAISSGDIAWRWPVTNASCKCCAQFNAWVKYKHRTMSSDENAGTLNAPLDARVVYGIMAKHTGFYGYSPEVCNLQEMTSCLISKLDGVYTLLLRLVFFVISLISWISYEYVWNIRTCICIGHCQMNMHRTLGNEYAQDIGKWICIGHWGMGLKDVTKKDVCIDTNSYSLSFPVCMIHSKMIQCNTSCYQHFLSFSLSETPDTSCWSKQVCSKFVCGFISHVNLIKIYYIHSIHTQDWININMLRVKSCFMHKYLFFNVSMSFFM